MSYDFGFLNDTIEINKEEMENNAEATNDLLVEDILLELGYNRKRNANVKRLYGEEIDWLIRNTDKVIGIRVVAFNNELSNEDNTHDINIVTNGTKLSIRVKNEPKELIIDILELSEDGNQILRNLSSEHFSIQYITNLTSYKVASVEDFNRTIKENKLLDNVYMEAIEILDVDNIEENKETFKSIFESNRDVDNTEVIKLNNVINQLKTELNEIKNQETEIDNGKAHKSEVEYRRQIEELHLENSRKQKTIDELTDQIETLKNIIENKKDNVMDKAKELLDSVEDDQSIGRAYVGVINNVMYREESIAKFIGSSIERLYELESFNLMPLLFDGDIFKIQQTSGKHHFNIGTREYLVDTSTDSEETLLIKLRTLFNKFNNVTFICKAIGNKEITIEDEEYTEEYYAELEEIEEQYEIDDIMEQTDNNELIEDTFDNSFDTDFNNEEIEDDLDIKAIGGNKNTTALAVKIAKIHEVMWNDDVSNIKLKEIMIGKHTYIINDNLKLNQQLLLIIEAILTSVTNFDLAIKTLIKLDMSEISVAIKPVGQNVLGIPFTRFGITEIDNVGMMVPIINTLLDELDIDRTNIELIMEADINPQSELNKYSIDLQNTIEYDNEKQISFNGNTGALIISGNITDLTLVNDHIVEVYMKLITSALAVKTNYMQERLDIVDGRERAYEHILSQYRGDIVQLGNALGSPIGKTYKTLSTSQEEVSDDFIQIDVLGQKVFISELNPFELTFTLIRLHSFINKDKSIGVQVEIDLGGLDFYENKYSTTDAIKKLTIHTILNYINTRMKK